MIAQRPSLLRNALRGNVAFSTLSGGLFLLAAGAVSAYAGVAWTPYVRLLGAGLLGFAAFVYLVSRTLEPRLVWAVIALDFGWVIGTFALLGLDLLPVTAGAKWGLALIADTVLVFALLQTWGHLRTSPESGI